MHKNKSKSSPSRAELVRAKSRSGQERQAVEVAARWMQELLGYDEVCDRPSTAASIRPAPGFRAGKRTSISMGTSTSVTATAPESWRFPPFSGQIADGRSLGPRRHGHEGAPGRPSIYARSPSCRERRSGARSPCRPALARRAGRAPPWPRSCASTLPMPSSSASRPALRHRFRPEGAGPRITVKAIGDRGRAHIGARARGINAVYQDVRGR